MRRVRSLLSARQAIAAGLMLFVILSGARPATPSESLQYTSVDLPGGSYLVFLGGINDLGQAAVDYFDANNVHHAAVRDASGALTVIDLPGAALTWAYGTNNAGQVVGAYRDKTTFATHGYVRASGGAVTTVDYPGAPNGTQALGINDLGQIVGSYVDAAGVEHGFFRDTGGQFTTIDAPNATGGLTAAAGINDFGQIAGYYAGTSSTSSFASYHGFVRGADGAFTVVDFPVPAPLLPYTQLTGINDLGQIAGYNFANPVAGFVTDLGGTFTVLSYPPGAARPFAVPEGINAAGDVAGIYVANGQHGFTGDPVVPPLPALAPPPPLPVGTAPEIRRARAALCLHGELEAFFDYAGRIGALSAVALVSRRATLLSKGVLPAVQMLGLVDVGYDYQACEQMPPDPNFAVRYQPLFHALPPVPSGAAIPAALAAALTNAGSHGGRAAAYLQAANVSLNRYSSALRAHDRAGASVQERAVLEFVQDAGGELDAFAAALRKSADLIEGTPLNESVDAGAVLAALARIHTAGAAALPGIERGGFALFGLDPTYLLTGGAADPNPRAGDEGGRLPTSFSAGLRSVASAVARVGHALRAGLHDE
ncbi:MAG: hypothetical protein ACYDAB_09940 [bacterium]